MTDHQNLCRFVNTCEHYFKNSIGVEEEKKQKRQVSNSEDPSVDDQTKILILSYLGKDDVSMNTTPI